jgi:hypothetical protein
MLIDFIIPRNCSEKQLRELAMCIGELLTSDVERQTASRLAELRSGGETRHPFRVSIDLRHGPCEIDLGDGESLIVPEGQRLSPAEVIEVIRLFVPPGLVQDVLVGGRSWHDLREAPDK